MRTSKTRYTTAATMWTGIFLVVAAALVTDSAIINAPKLDNQVGDSTRNLEFIRQQEFKALFEKINNDDEDVKNTKPFSTTKVKTPESALTVEVGGSYWDYDDVEDRSAVGMRCPRGIEGIGGSDQNKPVQEYKILYDPSETVLEQARIWANKLQGMSDRGVLDALTKYPRDEPDIGRCVSLRWESRNVLVVRKPADVATNGCSVNEVWYAISNEYKYKDGRTSGYKSYESYKYTKLPMDPLDY